MFPSFLPSSPYGISFSFQSAPTGATCLKHFLLLACSGAQVHDAFLGCVESGSDADPEPRGLGIGLRIRINPRGEHLHTVKVCRCPGYDIPNCLPSNSSHWVDLHHVHAKARRQSDFLNGTRATEHRNVVLSGFRNEQWACVLRAKEVNSQCSKPLQLRYTAHGGGSNQRRLAATKLLSCRQHGFQCRDCLCVPQRKGDCAVLSLQADQNTTRTIRLYVVQNGDESPSAKKSSLDCRDRSRNQDGTQTPPPHSLACGWRTTAATACFSVQGEGRPGHDWLEHGESKGSECLWFERKAKSSTSASLISANALASQSWRLFPAQSVVPS